MLHYENDMLCIEGGWLYGEGDVMLKPTYDALLRRSELNQIRRACRNTPALIAYDSIPGRFKVKIKERLGGDPREFIKYREFTGMVGPDPKARQFYDVDFKLPDGRNLPKEVREECYNNAIVLNTLKEWIITNRTLRRKLDPKSKMNNWDSWAEMVMNVDRTLYPHTLPANPRRLQKKLRDYDRDGYVSLINKNFCNKSAAKIDDEFKESKLIELMADPRNLDNARIARIYNEEAKKLGWKTITPATVQIWRDTKQLEVYAGRHGSKAFFNNNTMQFKRTKPSAALYYWTIDGWDAELLYQGESITNDGKKVTTYHNRLTMIVVIDPSVNYPIGYAIGTHENPTLIKQAVKNAINHTKELFGCRYKTNQMQSDNYSKATLTPLFEGISEKYTPARVGNAKSKVIEPWFRNFNRKYCQLMPNWSGHNIDSRKENQPNTEYLQKYKKQFPDAKGCEEMLRKFLEMERAELKEKYIEMWKKTEEERRLPLSDEAYFLLFGEETGYTNRIQGTGIRTMIGGVEHSFDCFDIAFRMYLSTRWRVLYDPEDTSKALAVNKDESLRFLLEQKHEQPMALCDRKPGDAEAKTRVDRYNRELVDYVVDVRKKSSELNQETYDTHPELNDTLGKMLLTNSLGQHKNQKNAGRLDASRKQEAKTKTKALKQKNEVVEDLRSKLLSGVDFDEY